MRKFYLHYKILKNSCTVSLKTTVFFHNLGCSCQTFDDALETIAFDILEVNGNS